MNTANVSCEQCYGLYAGAAGQGKPPCGPCPKPLLDPENEWLWEVFVSLSTQPRSAGMGGFIGFDYAAFQFILRMKQIPESLWPFAFEVIEALTRVASKYWNESKDTS